MLENRDKVRKITKIKLREALSTVNSVLLGDSQQELGNRNQINFITTTINQNSNKNEAKV